MYKIKKDVWEGMPGVGRWAVIERERERERNSNLRKEKVVIRCIVERGSGFVLLGEKAEGRGVEGVESGDYFRY